MSKIPDPKGKIAKAKARMPATCSVRKSKFCDEILSLRLQGHPYRKIEDWLRSKGTEFVIPAATIYRNLQRGLGAEQDFMPVYEQLAEENGGEIALDAGRTLSGQALIQRMRIDYMVRQENEKRRLRPGYSNPRIRQEMETYLQLVEAAAKYEADKSKDASTFEKGGSELSPEAETVLADMILSGKIAVPGVKRPVLAVVGGTDK